MDDILRIQGLSVSYRERERTVQALDGIDIAVQPGHTLAIVGESGCGKTTLALSILNLVPHPGRIDGGSIRFDGRDVLSMSGEEIRQVRGRRISMIFQDPVSGLNPVMEIGAQVQEVIQAHLALSKKESRALVLDALRAQGLSEPDRIARSFPFQLSGGMCQRVMIAIATVLEPAIIIADEPTSALDVTMQAAILDELNKLRTRLRAAIVLITHDLGVVAQMADTVAVMYAGRIVEEAPTLDVYARPHHPYTAALMAARPRLDDPGRTLRTIPGTPPDLAALGAGCAFLPRCTKAVNDCRQQPWPELRDVATAHAAACFNPIFHADHVAAHSS